MSQIGDSKVASYYKRDFDERVFEAFKRRSQPASRAKAAYRPGDRGKPGFKPAPETVSTAVRNSLLARTGRTGARQVKEAEIGRLLFEAPQLAALHDELVAALPLSDPLLDRFRHELLNVAASGGRLEKLKLEDHLVRSGLSELVERFQVPRAGGERDAAGGEQADDDVDARFLRAAAQLQELAEREPELKRAVDRFNSSRRWKTGTKPALLIAPGRSERVTVRGRLNPGAPRASTRPKSDERRMATKSSPKKTMKKPPAKPAPTKPGLAKPAPAKPAMAKPAPAKPAVAKAKSAKVPAQAANTKAAAVKKKVTPKPAAKPAKAASPATKAEPLPKKTDAKTKPDTAKTAEPAKVAAKAPAKAAEVGAKPVAKKPDGKVVPQAKVGAKTGAENAEGAQPDADSPLLDLSDVAVRKMITRAKQRGYVTYDELNKVLPSDKVSSEQIEDTMSMLNEMGINVIESEEQDEQAEVPALVQGKQVVAKTGEEEEQYDRTDDPVRMYLREMGSVELLSREGEIAIAKRIEAGRELMIGALCESPLTFEALTVWRDELNEGKVLLRDIIDLEAMYGAGPDGQPPAVAAAEVPVNGVAAPLPINGREMPAVAPKPEMRKPEPAAKPAPGEEIDEGERIAAAEAAAEAEEFDDEGNLSLSAMEAALKPQVLETLDQIASLYKKLGRLQDASVEAALGSDELSTGQERRFKKLRTDTIDLVKASSSTITASKRSSTRCTASTAVWCRWKASFCVLRKPMASNAPTSSNSISATSSIPTGRAASDGCRASAGRISSRKSATASNNIATRSSRWRRRCASRSSTSAASSTRCRRASAKAARRRRK